MNFATLKGLTIPEGVVTQIADASGRVLWKSGPSVATVILRPTADIQFGYNAYPAGSAGYSCIDEEVADGDATYIYGASYAQTQFTMSGTIPSGMRVTSAKLVCVMKYYANINGYNGAVSFTPSIGENTYGASVGTNNEGGKLDNTASVYTQREVAYSTDFVNALNTLGSGNISFPASFLFSSPLEVKDKNIYCTQLYIELTCEG